ncbi:MAG TPA: hypothetical protein VNU49_07395 [Opitutaceae bacterium]|jgi:hypothetical protein|nr:hypothetical protein [Opitutaceae bacterium]
MKKLPLILCALLGLMLLPWHRILPEAEPPFPDVDWTSSSTLAKYKQDLTSKNLRDDRPDYFIIKDLGQQIIATGAADDMWKKDPALMQEFTNIEWANRKQSYVVRLLENIYGKPDVPLWKSNAWVIPVLLVFVYLFLSALMSLAVRKIEDAGKTVVQLPKT